MAITGTLVQVTNFAESFFGSQISTDKYGQLFILDGGRIKSYSKTYRDTAYSQNDAGDRMFSVMSSESNTDIDIVEITSQNGSIVCRASNGLCGIFLTPEKATFKYNVARVTPNGIYTANEHNYYKSGSGVSPLVPMFDGNIISVFYTPEEDVKVVLDDSGAMMVDGNAIPQGVSVAGKLDGGLIYFDGSSFLLEDGTSIDDFGYIKFTQDTIEPIKIDCCTSDDIDQYMNRVMPETQAAYYATNSIKHGCSWRGVGKTGFILSTCNGKSGAYLQSAAVSSGLFGVTGYYIKNGTINFTGSVAPEVISKDGEELMNLIYTSGISGKFNVNSMDAMFFSQMSSNGFVFNYTSDRMEEIDWSSVESDSY